VCREQLIQLQSKRLREQEAIIKHIERVMRQKFESEITELQQECNRLRGLLLAQTLSAKDANTPIKKNRRTSNVETERIQIENLQDELERMKAE